LFKQHRVLGLDGRDQSRHDVLYAGRTEPQLLNRQSDELECLGHLGHVEWREPEVVGNDRALGEVADHVSVARLRQDDTWVFRARVPQRRKYRLQGRKLPLTRRQIGPEQLISHGREVCQAKGGDEAGQDRGPGPDPFFDRDGCQHDQRQVKIEHTE
jgi:hypothetical protein